MYNYLHEHAKYFLLFVGRYPSIAEWRKHF